MCYVSYEASYKNYIKFIKYAIVFTTKKFHSFSIEWKLLQLIYTDIFELRLQF